MRVLHWFRKGLRLHDNPALLAALQPPAARRDGGAAPVELLFVYILDPCLPDHMDIGFRRCSFLLECLQTLDKSLASLNPEFRLLTLRGRPEEVLPKACLAWGVEHVTYEVDTDAYGRSRDTAVRDLLAQSNISVSEHSGHTLWDLDWLRSKYTAPPAPPPKRTTENGDGPTNSTFSQQLGVPLTYQSFCALTRRVAPQGPARPLPSFAEYVSQGIVSSPDLEGLRGSFPDLGCSLGAPAAVADMDIGPIHYSRVGEDLLDSTAEKQGLLFPGGEAEALERLRRTVTERPSWVRGFAKPATAPTGLPISTTGLSPYLRYGCLSVRTAWWALREARRTAKTPASASQPPVSLHGQLLWREFFYLVSSVTPNYDKIVGNPICRQIPWVRNEELLTAWAEARTGFPFIDAAMTQLHRHGWMHHLARHAVACFLTRGQLWQSWTDGAAVFQRLLLDADWALNSANWMWLSASAFFHQYFRVYCPVGFGRKTDPEGNFIRHFLPCLKNMPKQYIYEPWTAPLAVQKKAGCIIGVDYPARIVDHQEMRAANLVKMKAAYEAGRTSAHNPSKRGTDTSPTKPGQLGSGELSAKKRKKL
ncbi:hypothetical protein AAHC03_01937 [Spirometra sp. Aus1]